MYTWCHAVEGSDSCLLCVLTLSIISRPCSSTSSPLMFGAGVRWQEEAFFFSTTSHVHTRRGSKLQQCSQLVMNMSSQVMINYTHNQKHSTLLKGSTNLCSFSGGVFLNTRKCLFSMCGNATPALL